MSHFRNLVIRSSLNTRIIKTSMSQSTKTTFMVINSIAMNKELHLKILEQINKITSSISCTYLISCKDSDNDGTLYMTKSGDTNYSENKNFKYSEFFSLVASQDRVSNINFYIYKIPSLYKDDTIEKIKYFIPEEKNKINYVSFDNKDAETKTIADIVKTAISQNDKTVVKGDGVYLDYKKTLETIITLSADEEIHKSIPTRPELKEMAMDILKEKTHSVEIIKIPVIEFKDQIFNQEHELFGKLLTLMQTKIPLFLYGPAGSGKTRMAIKASEALALDFRSISVNEQTTKTDFMGYYDANSKLIRTGFREMYEKGGVFIIDEIDAGNPNVLTVLNSALSNGSMDFPDKRVNAHEKFMCICTANTSGDSPDLKYIGRNILDAATLDRFVRLFVGYDRNLEIVLLNAKTISIRDNLLKITKELGEDMFVSTRSLFQLEKLMKAGIKYNEAVKLVFNPSDPVLGKLKNPNK